MRHKTGRRYVGLLEQVFRIAMVQLWFPGGGVRQLEALIDRQTFNASDYYRELCRPLDIEHAYFVFVGRYGGIDVWLNAPPMGHIRRSKG